MIYATMSIAHDAMMNEFNTTQKQLAAVNKNLKKPSKEIKHS